MIKPETSAALNDACEKLVGVADMLIAMAKSDEERAYATAAVAQAKKALVAYEEELKS